jgi:hypothetical protein
MKHLTFLLLILPTLLFSQNCYEVDRVVSKVETEDISQKRIIFGIKQMAEEVLSEKYNLCQNGTPIFIEITSIEAPSTGFKIGPWEKKKKVTQVKLVIIIRGEVIEGIGTAKSTIEATFLDLNNENLPFSKTVFASAVKKALEDTF